MLFRQIFDPHLAQYAYLVGCQASGEALILDPERDVDRYLRLAEDEGLQLTAAAETHIHADFLSGTRELALHHGVTAYLSDEGDEDWKYGWAQTTAADVRLLKDGDTFRVGNIEVRALHTPGHTPEHLAFLITDLGGGADEPMGLISGDFVFVGDLGRPDLLESAAGQKGAMEPSAHALWRSTGRLLELSDHLQIWPGHGAGSACGKALGAVPISTLGYERRFNHALTTAQQGEEPFVREILADQPEPPLYFARMKRLNQEGPQPLGSLPQPRELDADELGRMASEATDPTVILDGRLSREDYFEAHLPGSLFTPFNKSFPTLVGSFVDPQRDLVLILPAREVDAAVRDLVRIGYDRIVAFATPETLAQVPQLESLPRLSFEAMAQRDGSPDYRVLDVRGAAERRDDGHVDGSLHVVHTRLQEHLDELPRDRTLLVHCRSGARASAATALLRQRGFRALPVDDLFEHWTQPPTDMPQ